MYSVINLLMQNTSINPLNFNVFPHVDVASDPNWSFHFVRWHSVVTMQRARQPEAHWPFCKRARHQHDTGESTSTLPCISQSILVFLPLRSSDSCATSGDQRIPPAQHAVTRYSFTPSCTSFYLSRQHSIFIPPTPLLILPQPSPSLNVRTHLISPMHPFPLVSTHSSPHALYNYVITSIAGAVALNWRYTAKGLAGKISCDISQPIVTQQSTPPPATPTCFTLRLWAKIYPLLVKFTNSPPTSIVKPPSAVITAGYYYCQYRLYPLPVF